MSSADTIAAVASAPGRGAIGVVRLSGDGVARIATALLGALPSPRHATLATFRDADGLSLDVGIALYFPAPHSFTGEDVLELQGHGGPVVLDLVVRRLLELGCRAARPGEFSQRALRNGQLALVQAAAVAARVGAAATGAARAAVRSLQGEFSARIGALQAQLTALRVRLEAAIDFPDEQIDSDADAETGASLVRLQDEIAAVRASAERGVRLVEGITVVIAGKPNAGKSSLLNRLAGEELAIVTEVPGTTRDLLRHQVLEGGIPLHLVDTAGLRAATDAVEAEGIRRARAAIAQADQVLYLVDAATHAAIDEQALAADVGSLAPGVPLTIVLNKIDLVDARAFAEPGAQPPRIALSAKTGAGVDLLRAHLRTLAGDFTTEAAAPTARRRHLAALERARVHLEAAAEAHLAGGAVELVAEEARLTQRALSEITGEFSSDDLLGEIFANFCIGK